MQGTNGSWGYPLSNLMRPLRIRKYRNIIEADTEKLLGREQRTALSGVERSAEAKFLRCLQNPVGRFLMRGCFLLQRLFARTELSDGILLIARKTRARDAVPRGPAAGITNWGRNDRQTARSAALLGHKS